MELFVEGITHNYGEKTVLKDISFTMKEGIYGILGPNGAGKSTLIKVLTRNVRPSEGMIFWNGRAVSSQEDAFFEQIGYAPQAQALYPDFTARRYLDYIAALKNMEKKEARRQIAWILERVELTAEADKKIKTFSGGMKQRLLVAQAMIGNPKLLILDEPTAGLDPGQRIAVRNLISEIALEKIVIIATHIVTDIESVAKEVILLGNGVLIRKDSCDNLLWEVSGMVYEIEISKEKLNQVQEKYRIVNLIQQENRLFVRILTEGTAPDIPARLVRSSLEDVYLHYFEEAEYEKNHFV